MKTCIEVSQLLELDTADLEKLYSIFRIPDLLIIAYKIFEDETNGYFVNAAEEINITKMLEIIENNNYPTLSIEKHLATPNSLRTDNYYEVFQQGLGASQGATLCDALWNHCLKMQEKEVSKDREFWGPTHNFRRRN